MQGYNKEAQRELYKAISSLRDADECAAFFDDLCTINEIIAMSQRFEAAKRLDKGENYKVISAETGISSGTISRVSRCINFGNGGYKMVLDRMYAEE